MRLHAPSLTVPRPRCPLPAFHCVQAQARSLSQSISALGSAVKADVEQVWGQGPS